MSTRKSLVIISGFRIYKTFELKGPVLRLFLREWINFWYEAGDR
jgi:hypothetical protein